MLELHKENLWPIGAKCLGYSEDDLFDVIEFLHDHVSRPIDGYFHSYGNCGYHYSSFNKEEGQAELRTRMNRLLGLTRFHTNFFQMATWSSRLIPG